MATVLDQQYTTNNDEWSLRNSASFTKLAMSFTPTVNAHVVQAILKLRRIGSPSGNLTVDIYTDSGGVPGSVLAASSNTVSAGSVPLTVGGTEETFTVTSTALVANVQYWIVLSGTYTIDGTNYVDWREDDTGGFTGGAGYKFDGATWTQLSDHGDFYFKEYYDDTTILKTQGSFLLNLL